MFLATLLLFLSHDHASASENIRISIADNVKSAVIESPSGLMTEGTAAGEGQRKVVIGPGAVGGAPLRFSSRGDFTSVNGRSYRGVIEIRKKQNGLLLVVNDLDLEEYLLGVIAEEIPHDWEFEALKAQAVAARSYALYQKRNTGRRHYHILATVSSQVYTGKRGERERTTRAVRETQGMVLTYAGAVIQAFFHSSCGGRTENASRLWNIDEPYLKGVDCDCQEISKYGVWEKRFSLPAVSAALRKKGYRVDGVQALEIDGITPAGRVKNVAVRDPRGTTSVPAESLRAAIGYSLIPSVFFELETAGNEVIISGRGMGHGVGLCQWGAREMAQRKHDYRSILSHYYPGTRISFMQ